ncbi:MAG TPA: AAA family ATPase [Leptolinea sp.]
MTRPYIIAMAGLPGSGKSALASRLAAAIPAVIINKDTVRSAIFPPQEIEYSSAQDDFVFSLIYQAAAYLLRKGRTVILDGRPFILRNQRVELIKAAREADAELRIIYCIAPDEVVKARLELDVAAGSHPATDRDFNLYLRKKAQVEPIEEPHLELDTNASLDELTGQALMWLNIS